MLKESRRLGNDHKDIEGKFDLSPSLVADGMDYRSEWGVTHQTPIQEFAHTANMVVDQAFDAVAGTLHNKQRLDPNVASNARSKSIFDRRPVRNQWDSGRIGIEIDGVAYLFSRKGKMSDGRAMRRVALMLAAKLSKNKSWENYELSGPNDRESLSGQNRPVAVFFNTIKQALTASQELQSLCEEGDSSMYENITIKCLSDGIPHEMTLDRNQRRRYRGLADGYVDPTRGMLLIVQPSDYNEEYHPPGPAVGAINDFQNIVAQASIEELPTITLSPRFLSNEGPLGGGWDQSGYQKSATYGGVEPPKGPTPWIMRDFTPPAYCWVGNAMSFDFSRHIGEDARHLSNGEQLCYLSRVILTQSVMDESHCWHIYAAKDCTHGDQRWDPTSYLYLASTRSASGRPTRDLIGKLLETE